MDGLPGWVLLHDDAMFTITVPAHQCGRQALHGGMLHAAAGPCIYMQKQNFHKYYSLDELQCMHVRKYMHERLTWHEKHQKTCRLKWTLTAVTGPDNGKLDLIA